MAKKSKVVQEKRYKRSPSKQGKVYNRCKLCGRTGGYMRDFGMCRICFRDAAHGGELPGVKKKIW